MTDAWLQVQVQCSTFLILELRRPTMKALTDEKRCVSWSDHE